MCVCGGDYYSCPQLVVLRVNSESGSYSNILKYVDNDIFSNEIMITKIMEWETSDQLEGDEDNQAQLRKYERVLPAAT